MLSVRKYFVHIQQLMLQITYLKKEDKCLFYCKSVSITQEKIETFCDS